MIPAESIAPLLVPLVQRLRGVPETNAARYQTARDIAQMADDESHAQRITERLYSTCEWWPTPKQIVEAAVFTRRIMQPDQFTCSACCDTGVRIEWDPARVGYCKPGCPSHYCDCAAGIARRPL